jgi:adenylate cyclase
MPLSGSFRRYRRAIVTGVAGALGVAASLVSGPRMNPVDGFIYDLSLSLTSRRPGGEAEPVAVIALDPDSLASPELSATPRVFFSPFWAKLVNGLVENGAKAIGFDIIFAYSANSFAGFEGQYDHDFLMALSHARDRVVLARTAREVPARPYFSAVFNPRTDIGKPEPQAIASVEMFPDSDGVQRWITASLPTAEGSQQQTMTAALLARAGGPAMPHQVLLAPAHPLETIPTYRLIDVLRCLGSGAAAVRGAFAGKIVLIGTTLAGEDRKRAPDRLMPAPRPPPASTGDCNLPRLDASDWGSGTVPGVFLHAATIEEVVTGNLVGPLPASSRAAVAALAGIAGAVAGFLLSPWLAIGGIAVLGFVLFGIALLALPMGFWFSVAVPAVSGGAGTILAYIARFVVEERQRRRVQRAFSHYLAPSIVDRLAAGEAELHLGGERRDVSIMFADLSGFTALSGRVGPEALMEVTNRYLGLIVGAVEETGGYVDKFIGDAVMAIWGAPLADPDHAAHAAHAALKSVALVTAAKAEADAAGLPGYSVKMGLNSGPAVIGNVGAPLRYNYTAIGETVNIAARLEGVPHDYGCTIVVGPDLAAAIADRFVVCELDWVKLKGKEEPLAVFELLAECHTASDAELVYPTRYEGALKLYRAGKFIEAEAAWRDTTYPHASPEPLTPPQIMAARCCLLKDAPPEDWDGVFVRTTK